MPASGPSVRPPRIRCSGAEAECGCWFLWCATAIEKAAPAHVEDVRRNFIDLLSPAELDVLAALHERVLNHLATNDDSPAREEPS